MLDDTTPQFSNLSLENIDAIRNDFKTLLKKGEQPEIEMYLAAVDDPLRRDLFRALFDVELQYRKELSEKANQNDQEFADQMKSESMLRFPEYSDIVVDQVKKHTIPNRLGDYVLLEEIGRGGMGVVYRGVQKYLNQLVAIKVLPSVTPDDEQAVLRFQREMFLVGGVSHPNIVRALYAGEQRGSYYLVMELIEGNSVADLVQHREETPDGSADASPQSMPVGAACEVIRQATLGLIHMNELGLVHRDIKPGNIMLNHQNVVKLLDFGLGKFDFSSLQKKWTDGSLTHCGIRMGTSDYMAPEQWDDAGTVDIRADIYALGCSLYFMTKGKAPYGDLELDTPRKKMLAHMSSPIPPLLNLLPTGKSLEAVYRRMMAKEPEDRFQTPEELLAAIEPFADRQALANYVNAIQRNEIPATPTSVPTVSASQDIQTVSSVNGELTTLGKHEVEQIGEKGRLALLWLVASAFFMNMLDGTILNTSLPTMAKYFGQSPLRMQSVVLAYMLTVALLIPISGWLADRFGTRLVFFSSIILFCVGSLFCALSPSLEILVLSRIFQGIGGSMMVPVGRLIVLKAFPKKEIVRAMNFVILPALIGPLIGPLIGGMIVMHATWHWIFLINLPVGLAVSLAVLPLLPDFRKTNPPPFDWVGATLFCTSIICILLTLEGISELGFPLPITVSLAIAGVMLFVGYWTYASMKEAPLFHPQLFRHRGFTVGILGGIFARLANGALPFLMPLLLQVGFGLTPVVAGLTSLPMFIAAFIGKSLIEPLLNRFGYRRFLIVNTIMVGLLIMSLALTDPRTPFPLLLLHLGILGVFNAMQFTAMNTLSLLSLPREEESSGNGLLSVVIQVSLSLGIAFAAMVLGLYGNIFGIPVSSMSHATSEQVVRVFHATFITVGLVGIAASSIFFWTPKSIETLEPDIRNAEVEGSIPLRSI